MNVEGVIFYFSKNYHGGFKKIFFQELQHIIHEFGVEFNAEHEYQIEKILPLIVFKWIQLKIFIMIKTPNIWLKKLTVNLFWALVNFSCRNNIRFIMIKILSWIHLKTMSGKIFSIWYSCSALNSTPNSCIICWSSWKKIFWNHHDNFWKNKK